MEIETDSPEFEQTRRGILGMLVRRYPALRVPEAAGTDESAGARDIPRRSC
jgi:hypothetical protein